MGELKQDIHHHPEAMELMLSTNRQKTMEQGEILTIFFFHVGRNYSTNL
jgi:UDP-N-acetylmuramate-alanine ligase